MDYTWQGWRRLETPAIGMGRGPWLDLSQPLYPNMPRVDFFPPPRYEQIIRRPEKPLNVTEIQMVCHVGTHVDAPVHFIEDGPAMDEIPLERFYGPGVVWRLEPEPFAILEPKDFQGLKPRLRPGDILILDAGWWEYFGQERYHEHYSLSPATARWLVEQQVKLVGVDCSTVDLPTLKRQEGFNWPTHHILLSNGVLVAEHLTHLRSLAGRRIEAMFLPLCIKGADGAPARVVARPVDE
jgi:kynurenine formamidase